MLRVFFIMLEGSTHLRRGDGLRVLLMRLQLATHVHVLIRLVLVRGPGRFGFGQHRAVSNATGGRREGREAVGEGFFFSLPSQGASILQPFIGGFTQVSQRRLLATGQKVSTR